MAPRGHGEVGGVQLSWGLRIGTAGEGPEAADMAMGNPRMLKASGSYCGNGVRSGRKIMKPKVRRAGFALTAKKMNVWDPCIVSAGFF